MNRDYLNTVLKYDEGNVLKLYKDSLGYYTIGIGHLLTKENSMRKAIEVLDSQLNRDTKGLITDAESVFLLQYDIQRTLDGINNSTILKPIFDKLSGRRKIGLFSMCYQMGIKGVEGFRNSLRYIDEGNWERANLNLQKSAWYKQTPKRAQRVINIITKEELRPYGIYSL